MLAACLSAPEMLLTVKGQQLLSIQETPVQYTLDGDRNRADGPVLLVAPR